MYAHAIVLEDVLQNVDKVSSESLHRPLHVTRSFHRSRSTPGRASQLTRGFRKGSGMSKTARCIARIWSDVSQMTYTMGKRGGIRVGFQIRSDPGLQQH